MKTELHYCNDLEKNDIKNACAEIDYVNKRCIIFDEPIHLENCRFERCEDCMEHRMMVIEKQTYSQKIFSEIK